MAVSCLRNSVKLYFCLHQGYMIVKEEAEDGEGQSDCAEVWDPFTELQSTLQEHGGQELGGAFVWTAVRHEDDNIFPCWTLELELEADT